MPDILKLLEEFRRLDRIKRSGTLPSDKQARWKELKGILDEKIGSGGAGGDKRGDVRAEAPKMRVKYKSGSTFQKNYLKNLSSGGIFIKTVNPLPLDSKIHLLFEIAEKDLNFEVKGVVVWEDATGATGKDPGMGVKFTNVKPEVADIIENLVFGSISRHDEEKEDD